MLPRMALPPALSLAFCAVAACSGTPAKPDAHVPDAHATDAHVADASGASAICTLTAPVPPDSRLTAAGTRLEDGLGRTVFLRGVDAGGRSKFAPYVPFDFPANGYAAALETYMSRAESWGIDAMRVPFTWAALSPSDGTIDEAWLSMYAELLASAWSHGIWAVVDFHQDVYSEVYCGDGFPGWTVTDPPAPAHDCPGWQLEYGTDMPVLAAFDAFWGDTAGLQAKYLAVWSTMIAKFADTPGVLGFEAFNEPSSGTANQTTFEATTLSAFYVTVATAMRKQAPHSLVFLDATNLDGVTVTTALENPGIAGVVFAPHYYPIAPGDTATVAKGLAEWSAIGKSWNVPVFLGEFGASNTLATTPAYMASVWSAVDMVGLSGATEWEYSASEDLWNSETDSVVAPDGTEYPVAQSLIRPYARAVAGDAITQSWDTTKRAFALSYAPTTSSTDITEVRLPARTFSANDAGAAGKLTVTVEGACYDATSVKGELLLRPLAGAKTVRVTVTP
jgi:endoglycosylceramidase